MKFQEYRDFLGDVIEQNDEVRTMSVRMGMEDIEVLDEAIKLLKQFYMVSMPL